MYVCMLYVCIHTRKFLSMKVIFCRLKLESFSLEVLLQVFVRVVVLLLWIQEHLCLLLENYSKIEEAKIEELMKAVADSSAKVIVNGGVVGEMALHFCDR
ncbi:hypothetical protein VIGAN_08283300 [Vigna angularis var. angularis]|uniref:Uncharacterized protein n=1 Tax=Vigna angularis var. angularis TaxID=157739 RepID=A0A0S3ST05_PHAAN|nr:hypothetical protein VIGAN_08283300 [Vigna angularis var. angularis]